MRRNRLDKFLGTLVATARPRSRAVPATAQHGDACSGRMSAARVVVLRKPSDAYSDFAGSFAASTASEMLPMRASEHARMPADTLVEMSATGHCPHVGAPFETIAAIRAFLD